MARVTKDERIKRALKFLTASQEPVIAELLERRGFLTEDRQEGWALLDAAVGRHTEVKPVAGAVTAGYNIVIDRLDDWENTWFDVAEAALRRKAPQIREALFQNLSKTGGIEVVLSVRTFLSRLAALRQQDDPAAREALALLARRGLTDAALADAEGLIAELERAKVGETPPDAAADRRARDAAVQALWEWFLDWSKTARTVVKNRNYQVMLGLAAPHRTAAARDLTDPLLDDAEAEQRDSTAWAM